MGQWLSQRLTWPATWAQVCRWLRPGPSPAPPQAWSPGAEIPALAEGAGVDPSGPISAMEPVATWTPGKVAAWLRGG